MRLALVALLFSLGGCASFSRSTLEEGQWWSYATRPGEERSILKVLKVERWPDIGEVVHIQVFDTYLKMPSGSEDLTTSVLYFAIQGSNLRASLRDRVEGGRPDVPWKAVYENWRRKRSAKKDGVYKMSVRECVASMEEVLSRKIDGANPVQQTPGSVTPRASEGTSI